MDDQSSETNHHANEEPHKINKKNHDNNNDEKNDGNLFFMASNNIRRGNGHVTPEELKNKLLEYKSQLDAVKNFFQTKENNKNKKQKNIFKDGHDNNENSNNNHDNTNTYEKESVEVIPNNANNKPSFRRFNNYIDSSHLSLKSCSPQDSSPQGSSPQGSSPQGSSPQVSSPQGSSPQSSFPQASSPQGSSSQGSLPQGLSPQSFENNIDDFKEICHIGLKNQSEYDLYQKLHNERLTNKTVDKTCNEETNKQGDKHDDSSRNEERLSVANNILTSDNEDIFDAKVHLPVDNHAECENVFLHRKENEKLNTRSHNSNTRTIKRINRTTKPSRLRTPTPVFRKTNLEKNSSKLSNSSSNVESPSNSPRKKLQNENLKRTKKPATSSNSPSNNNPKISQTFSVVPKSVIRPNSIVEKDNNRQFALKTSFSHKNSFSPPSTSKRVIEKAEEPNRVTKTKLKSNNRVIQASKPLAREQSTSSKPISNSIARPGSSVMKTSLSFNRQIDSTKMKSETSSDKQKIRDKKYFHNELSCASVATSSENMFQPIKRSNPIPIRKKFERSDSELSSCSNASSCFTGNIHLSQ